MRTSTPSKTKDINKPINYSIISSRCKKRLYYTGEQNQDNNKKLKVSKGSIKAAKAQDWKEETIFATKDGTKVCSVSFENYAIINIFIVKC